MRLNKILLLPLFVIPSLGFSQYTWNYGIKLGLAQARTDIIGQIRWNVGAYLRYKINKRFSLVAEGDWIRLQGADSLDSHQDRRDRNLNFRNDIFEGSIRVEWTFYDNPDVGGYYNFMTSFNAYLFGGAGIFHSNPEAEVFHTVPWFEPQAVAGNWVRLRELTTEGEPEYKLIQPTVMGGAGFYYTINKNFRIGWDFCINKTFTDYLDDVSNKYPSDQGADKNLPNPWTKYMSNQTQYVVGITPNELANYGPGSVRGNPKNMDSFVTTTLNVGYVIKGRLGQYMRGGFFHKLNYKSRASF